MEQCRTDPCDFRMVADGKVESFSSARIKHIDVRFHFVRELLRANQIGIEFVDSEEQHADILTKTLAANIFNYHCKYLFYPRLDNE